MFTPLAAALLAAQPQYCDFANSRCWLCTASAAAAPRAGFEYRASGRCDVAAPGPVDLPGGTYALAPRQTIKGSMPGVEIRGQLVVAHPNATIEDVTATAHVSVTGRDCTGLTISGLTVTNDTIAVHMAGPKDGLASMDAAGAVISHVTASEPGSAVAAIVNVINGPTVECARPTDLVVRDSPVPQPGLVEGCRLISLSDVFQIYGAKAELSLEDEEPPAWLAAVKTYNWYATQAAAIALVVLSTVKPPQAEFEGRKGS